MNTNRHLAKSEAVPARPARRRHATPDLVDGWREPVGGFPYGIPVRKPATDGCRSSRWSRP